MKPGNNDIQDIDFDAVALEWGEQDGAEQNAAREVFGAPAQEAEGAGEPIRYYFFPTWRSQLLNLCLFALFCIGAILLSWNIPMLIIVGPLFSWGDTTYLLHLPLLILFPGAMLGKILINIYDAKYIIDESGVEAQVGLVSLNLRQPRLRWEDIRGVEPQQTIWERILGIGKVLVGSAMTQNVEIEMQGVANPRAIQLLIVGERERKLQELKSSGVASKVAALTGD